MTVEVTHSTSAANTPPPGGNGLAGGYGLGAGSNMSSSG
jgi:hypothetical protein